MKERRREVEKESRSRGEMYRGSLNSGTALFWAQLNSKRILIRGNGHFSGCSDQDRSKRMILGAPCFCRNCRAPDPEV